MLSEIVCAVRFRHYLLVCSFVSRTNALLPCFFLNVWCVCHELMLERVYCSYSLYTHLRLVCIYAKLVLTFVTVFSITQTMENYVSFFIVLNFDFIFYCFFYINLLLFFKFSAFSFAACFICFYFYFLFCL